MEFLSYIKELMLKYECLIIPDFGAFITRDFKGGFKSDENLFLPPYKEIGFNSLLIDNDGILVDFIAKKNNIPYTDALINLQKEVDFLKKRLKNIPVIIDDIGELSINSNNKVIFNPFNSFNFNLHSFGLSAFKKIPIKIDYSSSNTNKSKIHYMEKSNEESFSFKPDKSIKKFNPLKYVAVGIISILIISFSYYLIDDYIDEKRIISAEKGQEKIKKNVQKAKFNLGSISPVEINLITEKKSYNDDFPPYSVIAGSFRNKNNANKLLESLISEGYDAKIIGLSPNGLHRVAYGSFNSKKEALNLFYFIKYTLEDEAWYFAKD